MSRQTTLGRFGFKKSISHRDSVVNCNNFYNCYNIYCYNCIVFKDFSTNKIISIVFKISASALFLKYS